ncbi:SRPBCC family protein [Arthrobacter sp. USHLN218]|uniref:SRPBCC family protein n=1 Tax=Arthrobacter sp. USHLN218 TaxID=3081232 RepID=UPI003016F6F7
MRGRKPMTYGLELDRYIDAPADVVWTVLTDIGRSPSTLSGVAGVEVLTPGAYREGFRWRETRRMLGKEATEEMWVADVDAPHSTTVKAASGGTDYTTRFTLTPAGAGTKLRMSFGAEAQNPGWQHRLAMALFGRLGMHAARKAINQDLYDIAAAAEARREASHE